MLTPCLPTRPKHSSGRGPCELVLSQQGAGTEDPLLMGQGVWLLETGGACACSGYNSVERSLIRPFFFP